MLQNGEQGGFGGAVQRSEGGNLLGVETVIRKGSCGLGVGSVFQDSADLERLGMESEVGVQHDVSAEPREGL